MKWLTLAAAVWRLYETDTLPTVLTRQLRDCIVKSRRVHLECGDG